MKKSRPAVAGRLFAFPGRCGAAATPKAGDTAPSPKKGTGVPRIAGRPRAKRSPEKGYEQIAAGHRSCLAGDADTKSEPPAYLTNGEAASFDSFPGTGGKSTML